MSNQTRILEAYTIYKMKSDGMRKVLVYKITEAIYGTLLGSVLFYNKLKGVIVDLDFEKNEYDKCTFNKMINNT